MLKLLLKSDRHAIRREYLRRMTIVFLFLLIILLVIGAVIIFTTYLQVSVAKNIVNNELAEIKKSDLTSSYSELLKLSGDLKKDLNQLNSAIISPSIIINNLVASQPEGISVSNIHISFKVPEEEENQNSKIADIEVSGIAKTRSDLVTFQKNILENEMFDTADIPYSNFTKTENVPFNIKIVSVDLVKFLENE